MVEMLRTLSINLDRIATRMPQFYRDFFNLQVCMMSLFNVKVRTNRRKRDEQIFTPFNPLNKRNNSLNLTSKQFKPTQNRLLISLNTFFLFSEIYLLKNVLLTFTCKSETVSSNICG